MIKTSRPNVDEWECFTCLLNPNKNSLLFYSLLEVLEHLKAHEKAGHEIGWSDYRVKTELVEIFKDSPTPENIEIAMQQFFSENPYFNDLDCLFLSPSSDWQGQFLTMLEAVDFTIMIKDISHYFVFLNYVDRFNDRERAFRILKAWEVGIIKQMNKMGIDSQSILDELSKKERTEKRLIEAIFGQPPELKESLHDLRDVIAQLQSNK
ncbi:MAG: hypothetical protein KAS17_02320 [Victivallaceae bacterium]|nr:hypothetical protein [Victivallaceae bacterium]